MLFNSIDFLIFLPTVVLVYFLIPHAWRWIWLLASSCFFFGYFYYSSYVTGTTPVHYYIIIILSVLSVIIVDYIIAIMIERSASGASNKTTIYLLIGILFPLVLLFIFKYFNFFNQTISQIASFFMLNYPARILNIIVPVGISYYTFHSISYIIDVYRGQKAERHLGIFSLYILFFPKIVAGPIERSGMLIPQFREEHTFDYQRFTDGLKLMAWGFFKKIVIADRAAIIANEVFNNPHGYQGIYLIIACFSFIFQVYCDFSGYSDIAVGTAQLMGFKLTDNFRRPYLSTSISDLWRRWHITLISWLRDYIYIPLGGKRVARWRWQYNIMVIFLVSGIWHGANWTFIIWASLNGFYQLFSIWTEKIRERFNTLIGLTRVPRFHKALKILTTFLLFTFAGIFFRANTASDGFYIISHLHTGFGDLFKIIAALDYEKLKFFLVIQNKVTFLGFAKPAFLPEMATLALMLIVWYGVEIIQENSKQPLRTLISAKPWYVRWALYYGILFALVFLGVFANQQFIYFKF
ncbi:MAG TPA: MBOAT family O-acyltransferase [Spirochaetota bacterium]|nr:MBOAT family O-acyltransferase [Spirochaetota bacterium]HRS79531.1 MBOAT family O-acyltransferase [Spirochaetota bacterium]